MRTLRKQTIIERQTLSLEIREIVGADEDAPPGTTRRVRLLTPPSPPIAISIDTPTPNEAGPGRTYQLARIPTDEVVSLWLQPQQRVFAGAVPGGLGGLAELSVIVEFWDEEGGA